MMVNALIQQGPLSIAINAELLQFYKFGVWNPPGCKTTNLDHGTTFFSFSCAYSTLLTLGRTVTVVVLSFVHSICPSRYREQRSLLHAS